MNGRKNFITFSTVITLLLLAGCSTTPLSLRAFPPSSTPDSEQDWSSPAENSTSLEDVADTGPFPLYRQGTVANKVEAAFYQDDTPVKAPETASLVRSISPPIGTDPQDPNEEKAEKDDQEPISLAMLEERLSGDYWLRNLELQRWIDNDMHDPNPQRDPDKLRRAAQSKRLNMSDKEKQKFEKDYEYSSGLLTTWRWYHRDLEALSRISTEERPDPMTFFRESTYQDKKYGILRANAAILMGRDGDPLAEHFLIRAVAEGTLRVETRCAAAETLGKLRSVDATTLVPLLAPVREKQTESVNRQTNLAEKRFDKGIPSLWIEILTALAEKIDPWSHDCFLEPLSARNATTRLETARIWKRVSLKEGKKVGREEGTEGGRDEGRKGERKEGRRLPHEFLQAFRTEPDLMVRAELIRVLGLWQEPDILEIVRADLDRVPLVAHAAMEALADANCREAIPLIRDKLRVSVPENRAIAVRALCKLGALDEVFRLAEDKSWKVRVEVARALSDRRTVPCRKLAEQYLSDTEQVRLATLDALTAWPIADSTPLLLVALKGNVPSARLRARDILAQYFPDAEYFDATASPESMKESLAKLAAQCNDLPENDEPEHAVVQTAEIDADDPLLTEVRRCLDDWNHPDRSGDQRRAIRERLLQLGESPVPYLNYLYVAENKSVPESLDKVLAEIDPIFEVIVHLDAERVDQRRKAAQAIARFCGTSEISELVRHRILFYALRQRDPMVLEHLMDGLCALDDASARRLALFLIDSESSESRQRACKTLAQYGEPQDLVVIGECLYDPHRAVSRAALEAIVGVFDNAIEEYDLREEKITICERLKERMLQVDTQAQVDMAATLHLLENSLGRETLFRLSLSADTKLRTYIARTIVTLEDPVFIPILIRFLDDTGSIRQMALEGLPKLVGEDIGGTETPLLGADEYGLTQRKVLRWKNWFVQQQQ